MALLLHIDTSDKYCSAALSEGDKIIALEVSTGERSHASQATVLIDLLLKKNDVSVKNLCAVSVSKGPGSYTGLRIGVSVAKGICYALDIPLIVVNTLFAMASGFVSEKRNEITNNALICPMIDARRMEVYHSVYDMELNEIISTCAAVVDENTFSEQLQHHRIYFFGSGSSKCKNVINSKNAVFTDDFNCLSSYLAKPAFEKYIKKEFENIAYFEPYYLKDFITTIQKKNIL